MGTSYSNSDIPCKFWLQGRCMKVSCSYRHDVAVSGNKASNTLGPQALAASIKTFEIAPRLTRKEVHGADARSSDPDMCQAPVTSSAMTVSKTFLKSTLATIGPGVIIQDIVTGFESRRVVLTELPRGMSEHAFHQLLAPFGELVNTKLIAPVTEDTSIWGHAEFLRARDAAAAVKALHGSLLQHRSLHARLEVGNRSNGTGTFRNRTVKVSWYAPSRIAWARNSSKEAAQKQATFLKGWIFRGRKVTATLNVSGSSYSVAISNLPAAIEEQELKRRLGDLRGLTIGPPTYSGDAGGSVRRALQRFGALESFELLESLEADTKVKAYARFQQCEAAESAVKDLHNKKMGWLGYSPIYLNLVLSVKYTVLPAQFQALRPDLDALGVQFQNGSPGAQVQLRLYTGSGSGAGSPTLTTIRIDGLDMKCLIRAKFALEKLLGGETMMEDGTPMWHEFFDGASGLQHLSSIHESTGAFILRDRRRRTIRLFGPQASKGYASDLIKAKLQALNDDRHTIPLTQATFSCLMRGGLATLQTQLGEANIRLDAVSKLLTVQGDDMTLASVHVSLLRLEGLTQDEASCKPSDCPICFCEATQPLVFYCNHSYCAECLRHFVNSHAFPIACPGDGGNCGQPISLSVIQAAVPAGDFNTLLDAAFLSHIRQHPAEFFYCPTADCEQIYRPGPDGSALQCPSCLIQICPACHVEFHEGLTCAEQRSGGVEEKAFRQWKSEHGVKSCPGCKADIEKRDGCNHITCARCSAHICWVCMKGFDDGSEVYGHMTKEHGGFYDEPIYRGF